MKNQDIELHVTSGFPLTNYCALFFY